MNERIIIILLAYILDLLFGDPRLNWHPVRIIGKLIERLEKKMNVGNRHACSLKSNACNNSKVRVGGIIFVVLVVGITALSVWGILRIAAFIHPVLHFAVSVALIYFSLSIKDLALEAKKVYSALKNKNIQKARYCLSMIVGRDTQKLDEPQIIRATVETVAESTMDGITAPLFFAFLGGPILAWVYKAVNTLDSMIGYKNERFIDFGWVAAKLDGLLNFIPAKITYVLIAVSSLLYGKDSFNSFKWGLKYFFKGQENNSIVTEAAMAGALQIQLGGTNFYNAVAINKPLIGDPVYQLECRNIPESIKIAHLCSFLFIVIFIALEFIKP